MDMDGSVSITRISDNRNEMDFKLTSFSKFKRLEVKKELIQSILSDEQESAYYWAAELLCAGHQDDIWECFMFCVCTTNPKVAIYMQLRRQIYLGILEGEDLIDKSSIQYRNSNSIRKLFAQIVGVLSFSIKRPIYTFLKINREDEFEIETLTKKCKAPNSLFIKDIFREEDPREIFIACNEFAFSLFNRDMSMACYWIEWIVEFDSFCRKRKRPIECERRDVHVPFKLKSDIIWIFWDILIKAAASAPTQPSSQIIKSMESLLYLFCIDYHGVGATKKRRHLLYHAVHLIVELVNWDVEIINCNNKMLIEQLQKNMDNFYQDIQTRSQNTKEFNYLMVGL